MISTKQKVYSMSTTRNEKRICEICEVSTRQLSGQLIINIVRNKNEVVPNVF